MQKILALVLVAVLSGAPRSSSIEGSYLARTMNGQPLPAELHVQAMAGDFRLFRLEQGLLRLTEDGRFTLYFRYYHQLVHRGGKPVNTPVLSESESGTYRVRAGSIVFTATGKRGSKSPSSITATITGDEIKAAYLLKSGGTQQRIALTLRRDASYW